MKIIRAVVIGFVGVVTFAACSFLGTMIGISMEHDLAALATGIVGLMIGSVVGLVAGIAAAKFFADYVWVSGKETGESPMGEYNGQPAKDLKLNNPDVERQRVEKYGKNIVICSSCGTKNSLSFSHCINCSMDLSKVQPVDNPYL